MAEPGQDPKPPEKLTFIQRMDDSVSDEVRIFFCLGVGALLVGLWVCFKLHMENAYSGYSTAVLGMFVGIVGRNIWGK